MPASDFDIDSLAEYLHLDPAQVARMADRGKLPGRKISGQWRFSPAEIHHWLEEQIGVSDEDELVEMEQVLDRQRLHSEQEVSIARLLPTAAIAVPLPARTRSKVIQAMVELAAETGLLWDVPKMVEAVRARESLHPTALASGVALLHPRRPLTAILAEPLLALGRTTQGIPFGDPQGSLTDIFFLVCSTDDRGHLRTLARLSRLVGDGEFLEALRQANDPQAAHEAVEQHELRLFGE